MYVHDSQTPNMRTDAFTLASLHVQLMSKVTVMRPINTYYTRGNNRTSVVQVTTLHDCASAAATGCIFAVLSTGSASLSMFLLIYHVLRFDRHVDDIGVDIMKFTIFSVSAGTKEIG